MNMFVLQIQEKLLEEENKVLASQVTRVTFFINMQKPVSTFILAHIYTYIIDIAVLKYYFWIDLVYLFYMPILVYFAENIRKWKP